VLVLWVLMLLTAIVGQFSRSARTEINMTRNSNEATQAYFIARAGIQAAIYELVKTSQSPGVAIGPNGATESVWRINMDIPEMSFGGGAFKVVMNNENGYVNLNTADKGLLMAALGGFNLTEEEKDIISDSILDWRDQDDLHRMNGAEDDYYRSLPDPHPTKNADFDTLEELLYVRGVTPELYYGGLKEVFSVVPTVEPQLQRLRAPFRRRLRTISSNRININAAPFRLLASLPGMTTDLATMIQEYRRPKDFQSMNEIAELVGPDALNGILPFVSLQTSPYYRIRAIGRTAEGPVRQGIEVLVRIDGTEPKGYRIVEWQDALY